MRFMVECRAWLSVARSIAVAGSLPPGAGASVAEGVCRPFGRPGEGGRGTRSGGRAGIGTGGQEASPRGGTRAPGQVGTRSLETPNPCNWNTLMSRRVIFVGLLLTVAAAVIGTAAAYGSAQRPMFSRLAWRPFPVWIPTRYGYLDGSVYFDEKLRVILIILDGTGESSVAVADSGETAVFGPGRRLSVVVPKQEDRFIVVADRNLISVPLNASDVHEDLLDVIGNPRVAREGHVPISELLDFFATPTSAMPPIAY